MPLGLEREIEEKDQGNKRGGSHRKKRSSGQLKAITSSSNRKHEQTDQDGRAPIMESF